MKEYVPFGMFCPRCGTPNEPQYRFCIACGQPLQTAEDSVAAGLITPVPVEPPRPTSKMNPINPAPIQSYPVAPLRKRGIPRRYIIIGLAGLALLGIAGTGILVEVRQFASAISSVDNSVATPAISVPTPAATLSMPLLTYRGHTGDVTSLSWSPDGTRIASGSYDSTVQVWNATNGKRNFTFTGNSFIDNEVVAVAWAPNGKRIASASNIESVQTWNADDGGSILSYDNIDSADSLAWSPDSRRIASGTSTGFQIWNAADSSHIFTHLSVRR